MTRTTVSRTIHAPIDKVFDTIAHVDNFSKAVPGILEVEYLSDRRKGVGTRFRETRRMGNREASTELEVTEYVANDRVRLVADEGGTVWDTVFSVKPVGDAVELTMVMDAKPHKLTARLMNPLIKGMVQKHIEKDLDAVKSYCEGDAGQVTEAS